MVELSNGRRVRAVLLLQLRDELAPLLEVFGHDGSVGLPDEPGGRGGAAGVALRVNGVRAEGIRTGAETFHVVRRVGFRGRPDCESIGVQVI